MDKLTTLIRGAAHVLMETESAVRSRQVILRKAGVWTRVGRGRTMPDPTPRDATNLLLAFLAGGLVTQAAQTVRAVRKSKVFDYGHKRPLPPIPMFERLDHGHCLGDVLDTLLAHWSERGGIEDDRGKFILKVQLSVERTSVGFSSHLRLGDEWSIKYLADHGIDDLNSPEQKRGELIKNYVVSDRAVTQTVGHKTLAALAWCISDRPVSTISEPWVESMETFARDGKTPSKPTTVTISDLAAMAAMAAMKPEALKELMSSEPQNLAGVLARFALSDLVVMLPKPWIIHDGSEVSVFSDYQSPNFGGVEANEKGGHQSEAGDGLGQGRKVVGSGKRKAHKRRGRR